MAKPQKNSGSKSIKVTRSEDIDLPVYEPGGYKGIRVREWANLRKAVGRLSGNNSKWETAFNVSATSFFAFLIPAITTQGALNGWKLFFNGAMVLSMGFAVPSYLSWQTEKSRIQTDGKDVLELMDEIDSFYPRTDENSAITEENTSDGTHQSEGSTNRSNLLEDGDLLKDAIRVANEAGKVSTSMLQRKLRIGYSRAARIIDEMEKMGIVGESDGARPRALIGPDDSQ